MLIVQNQTRLYPEVGDVFKLIDVSDNVHLLETIEAQDADSCEGCFFSNMCIGEYNVTKFVCYGPDRPDNHHVNFINKQ